MKRLLSFFTACLLPAAQATEAEAPESVDFIRVTEDGDDTRLETAVVRFERDGVVVELIGAVHIADAKYYAALGERFERYDSLLYEGIGDGVAKPAAAPPVAEPVPEPAAGDATAAAAPDAKPRGLDGLGSVYLKAAGWLDLSYQMLEIDYTRPNFVHADLTLAEFRELQADRKESIIGFALKTGLNSEVKVREPSTFGLIRALVKRDKTALKLELVHSLGAGDDQIAAIAGESVIVTDRNAKCLDVLNEQIAAGRTRLGIFYGAAHFPDMEARLIEDGWTKTNEEWMTAWDLPG